MTAHDQWLARYRHSYETAYCQDWRCENAGGITVEYEEEYGQGSIRPEECPVCGGELGWDRPEEPEEEEE